MKSPSVTLLRRLTCALAVAFAPLAAQAEPRASTPAEKRPVASLKAEKGFFDDPMDIDPSGRWLAVIRTDSASFATLELVELPVGQTRASFPLGNPQQIFDRIHFTGQGRELLVITRDEQSGAQSAHRYDDSGKPAGVLGPAPRLGLVVRKDKQYLVGHTLKRDKKNATSYIITVHDLADNKLVGKPRILPVGDDGVVKLPGLVMLKIFGWLDGYSRIIGQQPGGYDKVSDVRVPDRAAIYDVLRGELEWTGEIKDVVGWASANRLRARNEGRTIFFEVSDDQSQLEIVDGLGMRAPLMLVEPFENYDPGSLKEWESASGTVWFSLGVDPLNPRALLRKKAEAAKLDLYTLAIPELGELATGKQVAVRHVLRAALDDRPVGWVVGNGVVVVLRKFKSFSRGGDVLEIFSL